MRLIRSGLAHADTRVQPTWRTREKNTRPREIEESGEIEGRPVEDETPPRQREELGSALALVPAGFLVLIILAAIAVDSAVGFLGQRQLGDALAAAANDAAAAAVSNSSFYGSGRVTIDPNAAAAMVCESLAAQRPNLHNIHISIAVSGAAIAVRGTAQVGEVFGRALPGLHSRNVSARASATVEGAPTPAEPAPSSFFPIPC